MFWDISRKIHILLIITLAIQSYIVNSDPECDSWHKFCERAQLADNPNFKCMKNTIYYYNKEQKPWEESRQLCQTMFDGSYLADLVQLDKDSVADAERMMVGTGESGVEMGTSGVCCMRKLRNNQFGSTCTWITSEKKVDLFTSKAIKNCEIVIVKFSNGKFAYSKNVEKSDDPPLPYLCGYNLPGNNCKPGPTDDPTTTTTDGDINTGTTKSGGHVTSTGHDHSGTTDKNPPQTTTKPSDIVNTTSNTTIDFDRQLDDLDNKLDDPHLDSSGLLNHSNDLQNILNNTESDTEISLNKTLRIIKKLKDKYQDKSKNSNTDEVQNFTRNIVQSCSKLLDWDKAWDDVGHDDIRTQYSSNILQYMQNISFHLGCNKNRNISEDILIKKNNIVIKTFNMDYNKSTDFNVNGLDSSLTVPAGIPVPELADSCNEGTAVGAMFDKLSRYLKVKVDDNHRINSNVVAFSIKNSYNSTKLPDNIDPVRIVVKHNNLLEFGDKISCVYWDFAQMNWSSNGCSFQTIHSNRKVSLCECNHLTNFAALMDVSGRQTNTKAKDILTKVLCSLSIVCLIITIGLLTLCRVLRNRRTIITSNLCLCLLTVNLLVVFGMDSTGVNWLCRTVSALLLYSILASFSWMLMEGYHLYQMIVLVFSNIGHLRLIYLYAIGYGAPAVITISALLGIGFNTTIETDSYFCWISSPSHPYRVWAVAGPALVAILANSLIMYLALREAFSAKLKKKMVSEKDFSNTISISNSSSNTISMADKLSQSFSWMKGFISLVVLLGITWISFLLYIHEFGDCFSYVFIILNGLQGVFIFTFQILLNDKARTVVRKTYHKRHPSRYLSSLYKTTSTNVFTSMRSKSISKDKFSNDSSSGNSPKVDKSGQKRDNDSNNSSIGSHKSQSIFMNRIRNASESILF